jgi:TatD DNase family protein
MLFDSHTHLNLAAFDVDRDIILKKYLEEGISVINVGTCFETSQKAIAIAQNYSNCWASVGLHPAHTFLAPLSQLDKNEISSLVVEEFDQKFEELIKTSSRIVAIGECGLDYSYLKDLKPEEQEKAKKLQKKEFIKQIKAAQKYNLPLILHLRDLYQEALKILQENNYQGKAVFHFFTGSLEDLKFILQNPNYSIGFSGVITYGNKLDEVIKNVPMDRLLIETDAPYVAPVPYRGTRNEPRYVEEVAKKIAAIKNLPLDEIEKATLENAKQLFQIN